MGVGMKIYVKYHNKNLEGTIQQKAGSAWIDLRAAETVEMKAGEHRIISLGVSIKIPDGYEAWLAPRSSTYKNFGFLITNSPGVIEMEYCGETDVWGVSALAMRDTVIHEGDRICHFRLMQSMGEIAPIQVEHMDAEARGGFGSTGIS